MDKEKKKLSVKETFENLKKDFSVAVKDKKRWFYCLLELLIAALLIVVDQLTKKYIYGYCAEHEDIVIIDGVIRFTAVENTGASFGIFSGSVTSLGIVSLICSIVLIGFIFYSYRYRNNWLRAALTMITAGAIGNVIDRFALGYVRDMVYFELIDFAVFNFADSCLTIGTALLIIYILFMYTKESEKLHNEKKEALQAENAVNNSSEVPTSDKESPQEEIETPERDAFSEENEITKVPEEYEDIKVPEEQEETVSEQSDVRDLVSENNDEDGKD